MAKKGLNKIIKLKLNASSVIEAIIASVIFLIIFSLALQTIVGMSITKVKPCIFVKADREYKTVLKGCIEGIYTIGRHQLYFEWGYMDIRLEEYEKTKELFKISITIYMKNNTGKITHRHIVKPLKITAI